MTVFKQGLPSSWKTQVARFGIIGALTASLDFGVMIALVRYLGADYLIATAVGFCVGSVVNYILSILWVFRSGRFSRRRYEFSSFLFFSLLGLGINQVTMYLLVQTGGLHYVPAKILTMGVVTAFNFVSKKYLVFLE
jgi:putative flippase GtrA